MLLKISNRHKHPQAGIPGLLLRLVGFNVATLTFYHQDIGARKLNTR